MEGFNVYVGRKRFAEAVSIDEVYCNYISGIFFALFVKKTSQQPLPFPAV